MEHSQFSSLRGNADGCISVVQRNAHEDGTSIHISAFNYLILSLRHEIPPKYYLL